MSCSLLFGPKFSDAACAAAQVDQAPATDQASSNVTATDQSLPAEPAPEIVLGYLGNDNGTELFQIDDVIIPVPERFNPNDLRVEVVEIDGDESSVFEDALGLK
jgi:hypothetical protein